MQKITVKVKDHSKVDFLLELLKAFDFVELEKTDKVKKSEYDFFASAGIWKNRDIDGNQLRDKAWRRNR